MAKNWLCYSKWAWNRCSLTSYLSFTTGQHFGAFSLFILYISIILVNSPLFWLYYWWLFWRFDDFYLACYRMIYAEFSGVRERLVFKTFWLCVAILQWLVFFSILGFGWKDGHRNFWRETRNQYYFFFKKTYQ